MFPRLMKRSEQMKKCECGAEIDATQYSDLCEECCEHEEHDHGFCMDCGKDIMDDLVAEAEYYRLKLEG